MIVTSTPHHQDPEPKAQTQKSKPTRDRGKDAGQSKRHSAADNISRAAAWSAASPLCQPARRPNPDPQRL